MFFKKTNADKGKINKVINGMVKEKNSPDPSLKRLNSLLSRKDIIDLENDKVDTLRLLTYYLESKEIKSAQLVKFLKS